MSYYALSYSKPQIKERLHGFKRVDRRCNSSILFTTMKENVTKLVLKIFVYLIQNNYQIAYFRYKFYKGIIPGYYKLLSVDQSVALNLEIPVIGEYYLGPYFKLLDKEKYYLNSILQGTGKLCINTINNLATVLEPKYTDGLPAGYISGINVEIIRDTNKIGNKKYSAFERNMHNNYPKDQIIMITDGKQYTTIFKVFYWKYLSGKLHSLSRISEIFQPIYDYVNNLKNIYPKYKIVFLMKFKWNYHICTDRRRTFIYLSEEGIRYFAIKYLYLNISSGVEMCLKRNQNLLDPYDE